ncbi:hypothetical protein F4809DRAFT_645763 [Biscogniauxia mediterranea]|nr:hypothetical protein F4809DRAFT_645763 [Biscogniauxia mediterranea]
MALNSSTKGIRKFAPNDALKYYYKTLHCTQKAIRYDTYKTSPASNWSPRLSSSRRYEMLGGSGQELGKTSLRRALSPAIPSDHPRRLGGPAAGRVVGLALLGRVRRGSPGETCSGRALPAVEEAFDS